MNLRNQAREEFFKSALYQRIVSVESIVQAHGLMPWTGATVPDLIDSLITSVLDRVEEKMPKQQAVCACHMQAGFAVCCEECIKSILCGRETYRLQMLRTLQELRDEMV